MVEYINLTPHEITLIDDQGNVKMKIPPSGQVVRVKSEQQVNRELEDGVKIYDTVFTEIEGLPEKKEDTIYIVSTLVLQALKANGIERDDVVAPNTSPGQVVRDENGRIIGVKSFQRLGSTAKKKAIILDAGSAKVAWVIKVEGDSVKAKEGELVELLENANKLAWMYGDYKVKVVEDPEMIKKIEDYMARSERSR